MEALKLISTKDMDRETWLDYRRQGIGGSDVSAICNMNRYRSPMAVYLDKIGRAPEIEENEAMYWGNTLESIVAEEFAKRTELRVRKRNAILVHPKYPFMYANIDREIVGEKAGLECKTANEYAKDDWRGETVPKEYALQCHHYMSVTGCERWYVAVLIGGNKFEWRVIERDEEIIQNLIEIESNFWNNHVLKKNPPSFGAHDETLLSQIYPQARDSERVDLTPFWNDVNGLIEARDAFQDAKFTLDDYKAKVKGHLGTADHGYFHDELFCTWKNTSRGYRQFKIIGGND